MGDNQTHTGPRLDGICGVKNDGFTVEHWKYLLELLRIGLWYGIIRGVARGLHACVPFGRVVGPMPGGMPSCCWRY